jgi:hypothetical protein
MTIGDGKDEAEPLDTIDVGSEVQAPLVTPSSRTGSRSNISVRLAVISTATVLLIALVVVSDSSRKHSSSSTTTVSPTHLVADLGQCPADDTSFYPEGVNAGVGGLTRKMVPITALNVLICRYALDGQLARVAQLKPIAAAQLETETNVLQPSTRAASFSCHPAVGALFLTFASDTQQVHLQAVCGGMGNGGSWTRPTTKWLNELAHYPSSPAPPPEFCCQNP